MIWLFWVGITWLVYVYVGYPAILWLLGRIRPVKPTVDESFFPSVSVLIAARNEEKDIGWKVRETLEWDYPPEKLEVLVGSDASEDRTDEIVSGISNPRVTLIRLESRAGKNAVLNRLAQSARGELLLFTDANTHIGPTCLRKVVRHFADPRVGCVTGDTHSLAENSRSVIESGGGVYGGYESLIKRLESAIGSVLVCDGAIFCIRSSAFTSLTPELANDLELPLRIGQKDYWVRHDPAAVVYEADTLSAKESFAQRRRISAQGMLGMLRLGEALRGIRRWQFVSRKFLRWLTLIPLLLIAISSVALAGRLAMATVVILQIVFYGSALVGWVFSAWNRDVGPLFSVPFYTILGSIATLAGVVDACRGRQFAIWNTPTLTRGRFSGTC